jgi:hypothetical protein
MQLIQTFHGSSAMLRHLTFHVQRGQITWRNIKSQSRNSFARPCTMCLQYGNFAYTSWTNTSLPQFCGCVLGIYSKLRKHSASNILLPSAIHDTFHLTPEWQMMSVGQSLEWELAGEIKLFGENMPQCHFVHHKPHDLTWKRTQATVAGSWHLTAWAMKWPLDVTYITVI